MMRWTEWGSRNQRAKAAPQPKSSPRRYSRRIKDVGRLTRLAETRDRDRGRPAADLDALAERLAATAGLPLDVAQARVERLAISARTRVDDGAAEA